jgi:thymidylate kinase
MSIFITFSGVDCAGKTTQLDRLVSRLESRGVSVSRVWHRPGYSAWLNRLRALIRRFRPSALPTAEQAEERERIFQSARVQGAWVSMAIVDLLFQYALRVRLQRGVRGVALSDRYLADAMLDLRLRFPQLASYLVLPEVLLRAACPRPDAAILLVLPWEEVRRRAELKAEPFPDPEPVRRRRHEAYMELSRSGDFVVIDASGDVEEVHAAIVSRLRPLLARIEG